MKAVVLLMALALVMMGGRMEQARKTGLTSAADRTLSGKAGRLPEGNGLAAKYPGDVGIAKDAQVFFADDFESGDLKKWDEHSGTITVTDEKPFTGSRCVQVTMHRGKDHGGEAKKWFMPGGDTVYARF